MHSKDAMPTGDRAAAVCSLCLALIPFIAALSAELGGNPPQRQASDYIVQTIHVLAVVVWIGGVAMATTCTPAARPPQRTAG